MNCPQHLELDAEYDSSALSFGCQREVGHLDAHFDGRHVYWTDPQ